MLILGYYGGPHTEFEVTSPTQTHDGSAVLLKDGEVIAAIEEERLNRIKHSCTAPLRAARFVLEQAGITLADVDYIAIPYLPESVEHYLRRMYLAYPSAAHALDVTEALRTQWQQYLGVNVPHKRIRFVPHHVAHATATFEMSGFEEALVMTIDGQGDNESGMVLKASSNRLESLRRLSIPNSLGHFYTQAIGFLGYGAFDEYKVMGLAPYGDPERFRGRFEQMCNLLPEGEWQLRPDLLEGLYDILVPRRKGEPIEQIHKDFAVALQEMLERAVFHSLRYFRSSTRIGSLCLGGGVAHNCTMNGNILRSGIFDEVFVHPAAHDGGNALGAALNVHRSMTALPSKPRRLRSVYWGTEIGGSDAVERVLRDWSSFVEITPTRQVEEDAAELIASGQVVGWVQGRSEFGPRALGNRSILADPRPSENKSLINKIVKTRESFRPFAPAVLEEDASDYFELPRGNASFPFMTFVLKVRPDKRQELGAVTHVDGTARVQTVSRTDNPRFWRLIDAFKRRTGIPVMLNTSFNNNVEPIVDSVDDALTCFLTTGLHSLVVGDFIIAKRENSNSAMFIPKLPNHVRLLQWHQRDPSGAVLDLFEIRRAAWLGEVTRTIPAKIFELLKRMDGLSSIAELAHAAGIHPGEITPLIEELWAERYLVMRPPTRDR